MADEKSNNDLRKKLTEILQTPSYSSFRKSPKQKIAEGLRAGHRFINNLMSDTTSRIVAYRDLFKKEGHNIIENKKNNKE